MLLLGGILRRDVRGYWILNPGYAEEFLGVCKFEICGRKLSITPQFADSVVLAAGAAFIDGVVSINSFASLSDGVYDNELNQEE